MTSIECTYFEMEVLRNIQNINLSLLSDEWVQAVYYSEFLEFAELPFEYVNHIESLNICSLFYNIMKSIDNWIKNDSNSTEEKSWKSLHEKIPHQKLLAVLGYYIDHGSKNVHIKEYRNNSLLSSRLYFKLLSIPGFKAYHIYHSQLFCHSLICLSFPKSICENDDNCYNSKELAREVNLLIKELQPFVKDLRLVIDSLQLSPTDMNFEDILSNLVDITGGAIVYKLNIDKIELSNISKVIYEIINILLCDANGEPNSSSICLLFKCFLPKLVLASVDSRNANSLVRASYVTYAGLLLSKYGKAAIPGFTVLLQHLCFTLDGLERAEVRAARVSLVIGLMSLLPKKAYQNTVKWLLKLSTTAKVSHRLVALEMLSKILNNESEEVKNQNDVTNAQSTSIQEMLSETNEQQNVDNQSQTTSISSTTDDESSQEPPECPGDICEDEVAGLLRQRRHCAPHASVLRAVYERTHDASGTLRARSLALLAECVVSDHPPLKHALQELDKAGGEEESETSECSVGRMMALAARCACDERAAVRRAAAALVRASLARDACSNPRVLAILVSLCRDASVVVRSCAIGALGELAAQAPGDVTVDAFLSGALHQIADPENKIQEQVASLIRQLVFDRVRVYRVPCDGEGDGDGGDELPWLVAAGIARHNLRRHLRTACAMLAKTTDCINHRLVETLCSWLGRAGRELPALVLLTCAAPHLPHQDDHLAHLALQYYCTIDEQYQTGDVVGGGDGRVTSLSVELLSAWERALPADARRDLRDRLLRALAANYDTGCRPACATLAAQLDPNDLQWAVELMQISERRALSGSVEGAERVAECVRAADLALVAPRHPHPALLDELLAALHRSTTDSELDASWAGAAAAGAGRLCLRSREAAARAAPALAALLDGRGAAPAPLPARINALYALTDICVRYTCIVEPLLGTVCGCVRPGGPGPLRRAAARALTRLLLGGYLRLRTPLYYMYCALLADEEPEVREPAEYYVTCCLTADTIYHHFVDCLLHYNKEDTGTEKLSFDARQLIYDVMLQRMTLVQKLNVQCRLAREVLQLAADLPSEGHSDLPPPLHAALLDAITLLCGPRMKLPRKPQNTGDAADIEDLQERVTTNIVSHKMKRTVAEELVPAVLQLYARLRPGGGQIAAYLVRLATDLLNDYRAEIEELIDNDEELVERVRQFQETIGLEPSFGNTRNLVTASAPPEPDTPRAPRRRHPPAARTPRKRPRHGPLAL